MNVNVTSFDTRRDMRNNMVSANGTDCGRVEVFSEEDMATKDGLTVFDDRSEPICVSECITGGSAMFNCSGLTLARRLSQNSGARKSTSPKSFVISFTSVGSGNDNVNYETNLGPTFFATEPFEFSGSAGQTTRTMLRTTTQTPWTADNFTGHQLRPPISASPRTSGLQWAAQLIGMGLLIMMWNPCESQMNHEMM